jgi:hypothetical protein
MTQFPQSPSPAWPGLPLDATFYNRLMDEMAGDALNVAGCSEGLQVYRIGGSQAKIGRSRQGH